jgi:hypothetical protein
MEAQAGKLETELGLNRRVWFAEFERLQHRYRAMERRAPASSN